MLTSIKQKTTVQHGGFISIHLPELAEGTAVEVEVEVNVLAEERVENGERVESEELSETDYLESTEANRKHLQAAIQRAEARENLVVFTPEEWNEKYGFRA
jgi:antitoxin YefM